MPQLPAKPHTATLLNIGCGTSCHPDWVNLDLVAQTPEVVAHDLTKGLPFPDGSADACYSSHVLEHLRAEEADAFLAEQFRVLKTGGVIRVVVPDLEVISRLYLSYLDQLKAGDHSAEFKYDYSLLEMFDQTTRERPGGQLRGVWDRMSADDRDHALARHGKEVEAALAKASAGKTRSRTPSTGRVIKKARAALAQLAVRLFMGAGGVSAFREGLFRSRGEIHRVMYDSFRLQRLLVSAGFKDVAVCSAVESRIPSFSGYQLDTVGSAVRKPDSLFMEALK